MTSNRYIILLISVLAYLLIPFFILGTLAMEFDFNPRPYRWAFGLVFITYPVDGN
jgi:hypothetical protein